MARSILDMLDEEGPEDESVIPAGLLDDEAEEPAPAAAPVAASPVAGGVPPAAKSADEILEEAFSYSPPPMVKAPAGRARDEELLKAQRADRRSANQGRASDALYSAFARRGLQNTGGGSDRAGALLKRRAVEQGEADRTRKAGERVADRESLAKALGVDVAQLEGLSDEGLSKVLGVKVGERKAAAAGAAAERMRLAKTEAEKRAAQAALEREERQRKAALEERAWKEGESAKDRASRERAARLSAGAKGDEKLERDVQAAGKDLEGMPGMRNDLAVLEKYSNASDIPGVGPWDSRKPDFLDSSKDTEVRQAVLRVLAKQIKEQSGATATEEEVERKAQSLGMGKGATEAQFRTGLASLMDEVRATSAGKEAKYRPGVVRTLQERGGVTSRDLPAPRLPTSRMNLGRVRVSNGAETLEIDEADLADAEAEGFKVVR